MPNPQLDAVVTALANIEDSEFTVYTRGWEGEISTALLDAVFSIRAKYEASDPAKGVIGRVRTLRDEHPEVRADLRALVAVGEERIREVMGSTVTGGRRKSECVIDAAEALLSLDPPIATAADALEAGPVVVTNAYTSVKGLGEVTAEYFQMLLGVEGVKADRMIIRYVNDALGQAGLDPVNERTARQLVMDAYEVDARGAASLTAFDHAIWLAKGNALVAEGDES